MSKFIIFMMFLSAITYGKEIDVRIFNTGDIHQSSKHLKWIKKRIKDERSKGSLILVDAGDMLSYIKTPDRNMVRDEKKNSGVDDILDWAQTMNYDAMIFGNHDFIESVAVMNSKIEARKLPFISANMTHPDLSLNHQNYKGTIVKNINGLKVGIVGFADHVQADYHTKMKKNSPSKSATADKKKITIHGANSSFVNDQVKSLVKAGVDFIIILSHNDGFVKSKYDSKTLAHLNSFPGCKVIISGHDHQVIPKTQHINSKPKATLTKAGKYGEHIGVTVVTFNTKYNRIARVKNYTIPTKVLHLEEIGNYSEYQDYINSSATESDDRVPAVTL